MRRGSADISSVALSRKFPCRFRHNLGYVLKWSFPTCRLPPSTVIAVAWLHPHRQALGIQLGPMTPIHNPNFSGWMDIATWICPHEMHQVQLLLRLEGYDSQDETNFVDNPCTLPSLMESMFNLFQTKRSLKKIVQVRASKQKRDIWFSARYW